jgi:hypothetical protein
MAQEQDASRSAGESVLLTVTLIEPQIASIHSPEPHAGEGNHPKRHLVGFSMASERQYRMPLVTMSGFAGKNGTRNSTTRPRKDSAI